MPEKRTGIGEEIMFIGTLQLPLSNWNDKILKMKNIFLPLSRNSYMSLPKKIFNVVFGKICYIYKVLFLSEYEACPIGFCGIGNKLKPL